MLTELSIGLRVKKRGAWPRTGVEAGEYGVVTDIFPEHFTVCWGDRKQATWHPRWHWDEGNVVYPLDEGAEP